jgi:hypothetical protein
MSVADIARTVLTHSSGLASADASGGRVATIALAQVTTGLTGPAGTGGGGSPSYLHQQPVPSTTWTVNHNLGYRPAITALSVGGVEMLAGVVHTSVNQAVITFDQPTPGQATCS